MAFCPNCGAQVTGTFCPNCGTAVAGGGPGAGPTPGPNPGAGYAPPPPPPSAIQAGGLTTNVASALCYLGWIVTGIVFLVLAPYNQNKTIRFHAYQSIFLSIAVIVISIVLGILTSVLLVGGMWWTGVLFYRLWDLAIFVVWLYMMYMAYSNKMVKLPLVGDLAAKQA
ncbi:MAG TPA: hypothetical protein VHU83_01045 [Bryobacteraceae bacterium]|jgi:uncharacterized membrane protein|nr:hypothetical protein [Bryobacteraceae bacterium]